MIVEVMAMEAEPPFNNIMPREPSAIVDEEDGLFMLEAMEAANIN